MAKMEEVMMGAVMAEVRAAVVMAEVRAVGTRVAATVLADIAKAVAAEAMAEAAEAMAVECSTGTTRPRHKGDARTQSIRPARCDSSTGSSYCICTARRAVHEVRAADARDQLGQQAMCAHQHHTRAEHTGLGMVAPVHIERSNIGALTSKRVPMMPWMLAAGRGIGHTRHGSRVMPLVQLVSMRNGTCQRADNNG